MPVQQTVSNGVHSAANLGQGMYKRGRGFLQDFKDFINKGNAFDLAIAFILSAAIAAVIKSLVEDIITPLFGLANNRNLDEMFVVLRCGQTCKYPTRAQAQADGAVTWNWGRFINTIIYLVLVGLFLFIIVKLYYGARRKVQIKDKPCPYCCKDVNGSAARCPFCTCWLENDIRRKAEADYTDSKASTIPSGERSFSTTTLGTSNGILKEKGSMEVMNNNNNNNNHHYSHNNNDTTKMRTGADVVTGTTGSGGVVYNHMSNNANSGINMHSMNNGYMSNQNNLYTNPLPGQMQHGYDGMGVPTHQQGLVGYDGMGVDQVGHGGVGEGEGDLEGGHGHGHSSSSKPAASSH
ncbi:large-conductance mechanosensitive channel [Linnemannia elongata]|nr:large-conductance mechanosensitive channel [Linnemannia elongata]